MTYVSDVLSRRVALLLAVFALAVAAACGGTSGDSACPGHVAVEDRSGLLSRDEAEKRAKELLSRSAPEVTGVEIEKVEGSCLTTLRFYQRGRARNDPDARSPNTPVWIVGVKGVSRPDGIAASDAGNPYRYARAVIDARTGEFIAGSRY